MSLDLKMVQEEQGKLFLDEKTIKQQEDAKRRAKREHDRDLSDIRELLKYPQFRRFFWRVLAMGKMFDGSFNGDPNILIYQTGMKNIVALLWADLMEAKPEAFIQMQQEYHSEKQSLENQSSIPGQPDKDDLGSSQFKEMQYD